MDVAEGKARGGHAERGTGLEPDGVVRASGLARQMLLAASVPRRGFVQSAARSFHSNSHATRPHLLIIFHGISLAKPETTAVQSSSPMSKRQKLWAVRAREELTAVLGGACAHCKSTTELEFHCIMPQGDGHHRLDTSARMSFYRREHYTFRNLQLLCRLCHESESRRLATAAPTHPTCSFRGNTLFRERLCRSNLPY